MSPPLVIVEGPAESVRAVTADVRAAGWRVLPGWRLPDGRVDDAVLTGAVRGPAEARAAMLVAVAGAGVIVHALAEAGRDLTDSVCDDLRRLGRVDHRVGPDPSAGLDDEQRQVLALLARGMTLGQAAARLHLSRRSVDRRLSAARVTLGVATSGEAVIAYRERLDRLGSPRC